MAGKRETGAATSPQPFVGRNCLGGFWDWPFTLGNVGVEDKNVSSALSYNFNPTDWKGSSIGSILPPRQIMR
jgi:hypothetical protein